MRSCSAGGKGLRGREEFPLPRPIVTRQLRNEYEGG